MNLGVSGRVVLVDGEARALSSLQLVGNHMHPPLPDDEDAAEYVVPISWHHSRLRENAVWAKACLPKRTPLVQAQKSLHPGATRDGLQPRRGQSWLAKAW